MPLLTYDEALSRIEEGERASVLLGNGFSRAWKNDIFNYASLLEQADFADRDAQIRQLFSRLETYDFEAVMRLLDAAGVVLETYGDEGGLLARIREDQALLKSSLIEAISRTHPELPGEVTPEQFTAVRRFLAQFEHVFTVNYDLLFYWARNMGDLPPEGYRTDDGFRTGRKWVGYDTDQDVHFLHGGLHIYERGSRVLKHSFSEAGVRIIDQVRDNLDAGRFPLFVSEPTSAKKLQRIEHNPYLNYCYRALAGLHGTFIVFGHSMDANDKHIFDQLKASRVSRVLVSIHGDEFSEANVATKANARAHLENGRAIVEFFDASQVPLWN